MKLSYKLDREDYLNFQMYFAFQSPYARKLRTRSWLIIPLLYILFASILFFTSPPVFFISFLVLAILWTLFFPSYQKRRMIKMYRNYNEEIFIRRFDKPVEISFTKDYVNLKDYAGESKIKLIEMEGLFEVKNYYYLRITTGIALIIPKQKIPNLKALNVFLEKLTAKYKIKHYIDLDWKSI